MIYNIIRPTIEGQSIIDSDVLGTAAGVQT